MKLVPVREIFDVFYGVNLELNSMIIDSRGVNFVSRSERNNGVSARVRRLSGVEPIPAGAISVAGGGSVMASFLQPEPFYSGRDLYYLKETSGVTLTDAIKLYYCCCLRANRYRFNYGRQANRTLRDILIPAPDSVPEWAENLPFKILETKAQQFSSALSNHFGRD